MNLYTRILQLTFDSAGADMIVNCFHPGTPYSKVLQRGVISPEVEAVKETGGGGSRSRYCGAWHNIDLVAHFYFNLKSNR